MKNIMFPFLIFLFIIIAAGLFFIVTKKLTQAHNSDKNNTMQKIEKVKIENGKVFLPDPILEGSVSIEEALLKRRSTRHYGEGPLTVKEISQLLWAAQGVTNERGYRTAPSAGATFPLETYIVIGEVEHLEPGFYHYDPHEHTIKKVFDKDVRSELSVASHNQPMLKTAPVTIVLSAIYERTSSRYGDRAVRYVHNEIGHASQNIHLQAVSLDLGTVVIGAYIDAQVDEILNIKEGETVLYMMPVGRLP